MNEKNATDALKKKIGTKLEDFRKEVMKVFNLTLEDFARDVEIPVEKLISYEKGDLFPEYGDLQKIGNELGINLSWLIYDNGSMFFCREKDMEEIIQAIEADENGSYEHYKMLLKSMRQKEMEDYIFHTHKVAVDLLSKLDHKIKESGDNIKLLHDMTADIDYNFRE